MEPSKEQQNKSAAPVVEAVKPYIILMSGKTVSTSDVSGKQTIEQLPSIHNVQEPVIPDEEIPFHDNSVPDGMKRCKNCGRVLPENDFNYWNKEKGTRMIICKECEKEKNTIKREKKREILNALKQVGCAVCGETDYSCLDFHHMDPEEKDFNLSSGVNHTTLDLLNELSKCHVVCSNCHRKIHAGKIDISKYVSKQEYEYRRALFSELHKYYEDLLKDNA